MAKPQTPKTTLTAEEALQRLGISHRHLLTLAIGGQVEPTRDGGLTLASVERYEADRALALKKAS